MFNPSEAKYADGVLCQLPYPTDDSRLIIKAVQAGLQQVFREGFSYAKAQVLLLDLCRKNEYTPDLFAPEQPVKTERLMSTLDAINNRWGRGTLQPGRNAKPVEWAMRRELRSPLIRLTGLSYWLQKPSSHCLIASADLVQRLDSDASA